MRIVRRWKLDIAAACAVVCSAGLASAAELRITFAELAGLVQAVMVGATIHLDNKPAALLSLASGSYLQIAGKQVVIPLPLKSFQLFGSTYAYYVDNLNSEAIRVSAIPSGIRLTLHFPSNEVSIAGTCVAGGCGVLNSLPKIVWKGGTVAIDVAPVRLGSSLSLQVRSVTIGGVLSARCGWKLGRLLLGQRLPSGIDLRQSDHCKAEARDRGSGQRPGERSGRPDQHRRRAQEIPSRWSRRRNRHQRRCE